MYYILKSTSIRILSLGLRGTCELCTWACVCAFEHIYIEWGHVFKRSSTMDKIRVDARGRTDSELDTQCL